jgi:hypothetical protein
MQERGRVSPGRGGCLAAGSGDDPGLEADLRDWYDPGCFDRPRLSVLGPVRVDAPGQAPADRRRFYAEVVTYLAIRGRRGATPSQLETAIWPDRPVSASSRRVVMTRVRRWLGQDHHGRWWLPSALLTARYRLANGYLLDWQLFRRLRHRAHQRGHNGTDDLRSALELVCGSPFDSGEQRTTRDPYRWLPQQHRRPQLVAAVADTAARLAHLSLQTGDTATARWAIAQATRADPHPPDTALRADLTAAPRPAVSGQRTHQPGGRA